MPNELTLEEAMDETIMISRIEASYELQAHGQSLLPYFVDYQDEMYHEEFSSVKILTWLGYWVRCTC